VTTGQAGVEVEEGFEEDVVSFHLPILASLSAQHSPPWSYVDTPYNPPSAQYSLLAYRHWHNIWRTPARMGNISYVLLISGLLFELPVSSSTYPPEPYMAYSSQALCYAVFMPSLQPSSLARSGTYLR